MRKRFNSRNKKKKLETHYLLMVLTGVCVLSILISLTFNISGGPLKTFAGYVFIPMQKGVNTAGRWISDKKENFQKLQDVLDENKELQKQIDELTTKLNTNKLDQYELEDYRKLLELSEKYPDYEKVAASVIAKDSGNWFSTFTIDKGTNDGIDKNMNVIAGSGLVGIVTDAGPNYAKVRCIIDDSINVGGMVSTTEDNCTVSGSLEHMNENKEILFSQLVDDDNKVKVGDPVVTSYVSDKYQQGILIGYISSIETNSNNLTKSGTITPVVDFAHIQNVLVILNTKDVKALENEKKTEGTSDTEKSSTKNTEKDSEKN